eukprot:354940-Chlamydomonas_euryale.AAC.3
MAQGCGPLYLCYVGWLAKSWFLSSLVARMRELGQGDVWGDVLLRHSTAGRAAASLHGRVCRCVQP